MNPFAIDPGVLRTVGRLPALVYAVLSASDTGDGVELAYSQIADAASISLSSARRAIRKLIAAGLVSSDPTVVEIYGQQANRYKLLGPAQPPVQNEQPCVYPHSSKLISIQVDDSTHMQIANSVDYQSNPVTQGNHRGTQDCPRQSRPISWDCVRAWTPIGSPMPPPAGANLMKRCRERLWLVSYAEAYIVDRANFNRLRKGWKQMEDLPEDRRFQFLRDAEALLTEHPLGSIVDAIDWVFINHSGWLPFDVIDSYGMTRSNGERKVTSLRKIRENFDVIMGVRSIEQVASS